MHYIGLMSGTSVDAIDAVLVAINPAHTLRLLATWSHPIPGDVHSQIEALMAPGENELFRAGELDVSLGHMFADAALAVLSKGGLKPQDIRAIGCHGQTIRHHPHARFPFTRQIGNPSVIAERCGIPTIADFRTRDLAAGGQGAPLAPAFHAWAFRSRERSRAIVNIGGIANVTLLPAADELPVLGFDTGPGNTLLDQWNRYHRGSNVDEGGAWAESGRLNEELLAVFLQEPFFSLAPPKSTGRELFNRVWLDHALAKGFERVAAVDVQATLVELTARTIADALCRHAPEVVEIFVCGGGHHNRALMRALRRNLPGMRVDTTDVLGIHPDWVEGCVFAWLAHQTLEGKPGNVPSVTGARHAVVLGGIFPA